MNAIKTDKSAAIFSLGCKVNQYDELVIARSLMDAGFAIVPFDHLADLYVINSCTVTHRGDSDSRKAARNALRRNPDAVIVMAGCYAQRAGDDIAMIDGVDIILGNREKLNISAFLPDPLIKSETPAFFISDPTSDDSFGSQVSQPLSRSRALLKIQDGCNQFCSYCIVPHVRGEPRSLKREEVLKRAAELIAMGYQEIVITGVHLGLWGREYDDNLAGLLKCFEDLDGIYRFRISSIEPMEVNDELIEVLASSNRICRHLHIPVQSGSDNVLKHMNRPYRISSISHLFEKIKSIDPGWNIGTDLIIGYPTESDDDFAEQIKNLEHLPIDYYHLFTYSPRSGTPAAEIKAEHSIAVVKDRLNLLKKIDSESRKKFLMSQISCILEFLIEKYSKRKDDINIGLSDNYIRVQIPGAVNITGFCTARLVIDKELKASGEII